MKHLKDYHLYNEAKIYTVEDITNLLNNVLNQLGLKLVILKGDTLQSVNGNSVRYFDRILVNFDLCKIRTSLLTAIVNCLMNTTNAAEVFPVLKTLELVDTEGILTITIDPTIDFNKEENTLNKYTYINQPIDLYHKVLIKIKEILILTTGELNIYALTQLPEGPQYIESRFIDLIMIEYILYLQKLNPQKLLTSSFNFDELYKIAYKYISSYDDAPLLLNRMKDKYPDIFNKIKKIAPQIDFEAADKLGEMGF